MAAEPVPRIDGRLDNLAWQARIVRVLAATQFKLKYADSVLGYFWSLARPLALFSILYVVFGRALRLGESTQNYPLFLLIGIVLFAFFADATSRTMTSIVEQSQLMRKLRFPPLIIPLSSGASALITFALNVVAIVAFVAWARITPELDWLLIIPLLVELFAFVLGVSLILATLFARFQDIGAIWEIVSRVLFYAFGIIFPLQLLPAWAERVMFLVPFPQVMQDVRAIVLDQDDLLTAGDVLGGPLGHAAPIAISVAVLVAGILFFKRQEWWFAEKV